MRCSDAEPPGNMHATKTGFFRETGTTIGETERQPCCSWRHKPFCQQTRSCRERDRHDACLAKKNRAPARLYALVAWSRWANRIYIVERKLQACSAPIFKHSRRVDLDGKLYFGFFHIADSIDPNTFQSFKSQKVQIKVKKENPRVSDPTRLHYTKKKKKLALYFMTSLKTPTQPNATHLCKFFDYGRRRKA